MPLQKFLQNHFSRIFRPIETNPRSLIRGAISQIRLVYPFPKPKAKVLRVLII